MASKRKGRFKEYYKTTDLTGLSVKQKRKIVRALEDGLPIKSIAMTLKLTCTETWAKIQSDLEFYHKVLELQRIQEATS